MAGGVVGVSVFKLFEACGADQTAISAGGELTWAAGGIAVAMTVFLY